jgi:hypothetical protein
MNKSALYVGLMILLLGAIFLLMNVGAIVPFVGEFLRIGRLWPLLIIWASLWFYLPVFIWWERRAYNYGLTMPGTIILVNGLILLYCSLTRRWEDWSWLWTLEPLSVALGLLAMWLLGPKAPALAIAALIIGGVSLALMAIMVTLVGGTIGGIVGAGLLVLLGLILLLRALIRPATPAA